jgi:hypothetical protein
MVTFAEAAKDSVSRKNVFANIRFRKNLFDWASAPNDIWRVSVDGLLSMGGVLEEDVSMPSQADLAALEAADVSGSGSYWHDIENKEIAIKAKDSARPFLRQYTAGVNYKAGNLGPTLEDVKYDQTLTGVPNITKKQSEIFDGTVGELGGGNSNTANEKAQWQLFGVEPDGDVEIIERIDVIR